MKTLLWILLFVNFLIISLQAPSQEKILTDSFNYYFENKNFSEALKLWDVFKNGCKDPDIIKNAGNCFFFSTQYEFALENYYKALGMIDDESINLKISLLLNIGNTLRRIGNPNKSLEFITSAQELSNANQISEFNVSIELSLAKHFQLLDNIDKTEYHLLNALEGLSDKSTVSEDHFYVYSNISTFYRNNGQLKKALHYNLTGLKWAEQNFKNSYYHYALNYGVALTCYQLGQYKEAIYYFTQSHQLIPDSSKEYLSYIENALEYCYSQINEDEIFRTFTPNKFIDTVAQSIRLIYYGKYLENNLKKTPDALKFFYEAFSLLKHRYGNYHRELEDNYRIIATSQTKLHRPDSALYYYQRALYCRNPETDTADYASNPPNLRQCDRWVLDVTGRKIRALNMLRQEETDVDSCMAINRLIAANAAYYASLVEVLLRDKTFLADQMHLLREDIRSYMLAGMDACYALHEKNGGDHYFKQALMFSETGKYLLLKSMMDSRANKKRLPDSLASLDSELHGRINRLHMDIERRKADGQNQLADSLDKTLFALILRKDSLRNVILQQVPGIQRWETHDVDIDRVVESLSPEQVLVEYYLQDSVLHSFMLSQKGGMQWKRTKVDKDFYTSVENVIRTCNPFEAQGVDMQTFCESSFFLYNILLGDAHAQDLLLIPDGPLTYLPFGVLLTGIPKTGASWRGLPYLLRSHRVARYHSLRFVKPDNKKKYTSINFLALAPSFGTDTAFAGWDLPAAHEEAGQLMELFDGTILLDTAATADGFMQHAAGKQILHFATHAQTDSANAFDSRLMLSGGTASSAPQPLYASDICSMDLDAALAVLSSCNSGNGTLLQGEGVISLAWAFSYAGCGSVAMSLFPLDDLSAKAVMSAFYRHLKEGQPGNEALRLAKLEYLETTVPFKSHPQYWAGIVLSGNPTPLVTPLLKRPLVQTTLLLAGAVLLMVLVMAGRKRRANGGGR